VDGVIFSAGDSLAAIQGIKALRDLHIIPVALSGLFTASPLLIREVKTKTHLPIFTIEQLAQGEIINLLDEPLNATA
jgi:hypothetical protein